MTSDPGLSARHRPMICSLRPSPYTSAVSRKVTPDSTAACSTSSASDSVTEPQSAPSCQVPRPMIDTGRPVLPRTRCSIVRDLSQTGPEPGHRASAARCPGAAAELVPDVYDIGPSNRRCVRILLERDGPVRRASRVKPGDDAVRAAGKLGDSGAAAKRVAGFLRTVAAGADPAHPGAIGVDVDQRAEHLA